MRTIDPPTMSKTLLDTKWLSIEEKTGRIVGLDRPTRASGRYNTDGAPSAGMAEVLSNEIMPDRIESGIIWVHGIFPVAEAPIAVMLRLLESSDTAVARGALGVVFDREYERLLSVLAWSLAPSWNFEFVALPQRFLAEGQGGEMINMRWCRSQALHHQAEELLNNMNYKITRK